MSTKKNKAQFVTKTPTKSNKKYLFKPGKVAFYDTHPYFSFRHYHISKKEFTVEQFKSQKEFCTFFERLHAMSSDTWRDILVKKRSFYHAHEVNWADTAYPKGFSHLPDNLQELPVYQFEIFQECRVFGFFNHDNVFKIVWVDRNHIVYPRHD